MLDWGRVAGAFNAIRMLSKHRPANLAPAHDNRFLRRHVVGGKPPGAIQQKHVYQVRDHLCVFLVGVRIVALGSVSHLRPDHYAGAVLHDEVNNEDSDSCPAAMEVEGIVLPVDEPFVLHLRGDQAAAKEVQFILRKGSIQRYGRPPAGKGSGAPIGGFRISH